MKKTVLIVIRVVCIVGFLVCVGVLGWYWHSDRSDRAVAEALAAAHDAADVFKFPAVARAAGRRAFFEDMDAFALHLAVAHQIAGSRQSCKAAADDVGRFSVYALGLLGTCKGFIVTARIIHIIYLL